MSLTVSSVITYARIKAQTDTAGLSDTNGINFTNEARLDMISELIKNKVDAAQIQEAYRDASAGVGTYLYPTDMYFLKTIELNLTDTQQGDYVPANQIDISNLPSGQTFDWLRVNASPQSPNFDDHGDWYEIFPTPTSAMNLTKAIKIFYFLQPTLYVNTTDVLVYPDTLDYYILVLKVTSLYYESIDKFDEAQKFEAQYKLRLQKLVDTLKKGEQTPQSTGGIQLTGYEF